MIPWPLTIDEASLSLNCFLRSAPDEVILPDKYPFQLSTFSRSTLEFDFPRIKRYNNQVV